jgi:hypothetical protein
MSERERLELLAQSAPVARTGLADDVIDRARHNRVRWWAVSSVCAAVALIAAVPLAVAINRSPHPAAPGASTNTQATTNTRARAPSDEAQAYAAGVEYLTGQLVPGQHWQVLYVLEDTCANTVSPTQSCDPRPITAVLRHDLVSALRPYAPVQFVAADAKIRDKNLRVINEGVAVTLGGIVFAQNADTARLELSVQCGGLCGMGQTLLLAKQGEVWKVTGSTGPAWIS